MTRQSGVHQKVLGTIVATTATKARRPTRKGCPNHPIEFKRELAAAACDPAVSVAKLALEHAVNANLLFKWRRQYRQGKFGALDPSHLLPTLAVPAEVSVRSEAGVTLLPVQTPATEVTPVETPACVEVVFACVTVRITGSPEKATLRTVLDTLARRS
jgi:transposase